MAYKKKGRPLGEKHKDSKLTNKMVKEIRERKGELLKVLAIEYGVHISTIDLVLKRKTWKHV